MHPTNVYEMSVGEHHRRIDDRQRDHLTALRRRERDEDPTSAVPAPGAAGAPAQHTPAGGAIR